jgi:hypothetical protein
MPLAINYSIILLKLAPSNLFIVWKIFNHLKPSGHCMCHQFNIQQFYVLPTQCIYVFCVNLRRVIISLYSINWLDFITETERVYCAVWTEYFSHGQIAKAWQAGFNLKANPHEFWGGKCGTVMDLVIMKKVLCGLPQSLKEIPPVK